MSILALHTPTGLWADTGYKEDPGYGVEPAVDFSWFGEPPPFPAENHDEWKTLDAAITDLKHQANAYSNVEGEMFDETDEEIMLIERCRAAGQVCHLHWYPRTTVSFYTLTYPTWEELIAEAQKLQRDVINPNWKGIIDIPDALNGADSAGGEGS